MAELKSGWIQVEDQEWVIDNKNNLCVLHQVGKIIEVK